MKTVLVVIALLCVPAAGAASAWTPQLELSGRYVDGPDQTGAVETKLSPSLQWDGTRAQFRASARLRWLSSPRYDALDADHDTYAEASRPENIDDRGVAELRDFYYEYRYRSTRLKVGKQAIDWGLLDGFKVLDVVNPQDFREFILDDFSSSRISTWSVLAQANSAHFEWEAYWTADHTVHDLPDERSHFDFTAAGYQIPRGFEIVRPRQNSWGTRFGVRLGDWRVRASFVDNHEHFPVATVAAGNGVSIYPERRLYGLQFEGNVGTWVIRGEFNYQPDEVFRDVETGLLTDRDNYSTALAADFQALGWFVSVQWVHEAYAPNTRHQQLFTALVKRSFWNERLDALIRWYGSDRHDALYRLGLELELPGALGRLQLGGDVFRGSADTLFGQFSARDQYFVGWRKTF